MKASLNIVIFCKFSLKTKKHVRHLNVTELDLVKILIILYGAEQLFT